MLKRKPWIGLALAVAGLGAAGCDLGPTPSPPGAAPPLAVTGLTCRAKDGKVDLAWHASQDAVSYRVTRSSAGADSLPLAQTPGVAFADYQAPEGVALAYVVTPVGTDSDGPASAPCSVTPAAAGGPAAATGLVCRAKDGKIDVAWTAVAGASRYVVYRKAGSAARTQLVETATPVFADFALVNGTAYAYDIVALDARGRASASSAVCSATPVAGGARGSAPPAVGAVTCRGKAGKADVSWAAVPGAAFYRIYRSADGAPPSAAGETTQSVFVDFGLEIGRSYGWQVVSVGAGGAAAAASTACTLTASGRDTGPVNQPPQITSQPLTTALEDHFYYSVVTAHDPENGAVTLAIASGPPGLALDPGTGLLSWSPSHSQVGTQMVELRATDPQGAYGSQTFAIDVSAYNQPPVITSIPGRVARAGQPYQYAVQAYDPEGQALRFAFAAPTPAGMSLDETTGLVTWTPQVSDAGSPTIAVRVADSGSAFATQSFGLEVTSEPLRLLEPAGDRTIRPGETLKLRLVANYGKAGFRVSPALANAKLENAEFEFSPGANQEGVFDLGFEAVLGEERDGRPIRITVQRDNAAPVIAPIGPNEVKEGEALHLAVEATDADGDAIGYSAPGLSLENAVFDEISHTLSFSPSFEQAGSYSVTLVVTDGKATATTQIPITVTEAAPPVTDLDLAVDPPQSPTLGSQQTIAGSIRGSSGQGGGAPKTPLVVGLAPVSVRQGRTAIVSVTGRDTQFAAGAVSADFGDGIAVQKVEVVSPTQAVVTVLAATDAALGIRSVRLRQGGLDDATSVVAFSVAAGAAQISGSLVDSFTGAPLANARVSVQGSSVTATTDSQGHFTLDGVAPGEASVVVTVANYAVSRLSVAAQPNQAVQLGDPLQLDALARPFAAGGSLPRAPTAASLIDRNIGSKDADGLTYEAARAVVQDTMLAIGGDDTGILDDSGRQLNPNLVGPGFLSLSPAGVDGLARLLLRGDTWTLSELVFVLDGSLGWVFSQGVDLDATRERLQLAALRAWAKPGDSDNLLTLLLLNEGTSLSAQPPTVTDDTRFNNFQAYLFVMSFLHTNFTALSAAVDAQLVRVGIDPASVLARNGAGSTDLADHAPSPDALEIAKRAALFAARTVAGQILPGSAWAAPPAPQDPPNTVNTTAPKSRWGAVWNALIPAAVAAIVAAVVAMAFVALIALASASVAAVGVLIAGTGATISLVGLGSALGTAAVGAAASQFGAKLLFAFLADPNAALNLTPAPASVVDQRTFAAAHGQDKVRIVFERSPTDVKNEQTVLAQGTDTPLWKDATNLVEGAANPQQLDYRYHLWKLPNQTEPPSFASGSGAKLVSTRTQPVPRDPNNPGKTIDPKFLEFVLDDNLDNVKPGPNYFRVVTVQFYRRWWAPDPDTGPPGGDPPLGLPNGLQASEQQKIDAAVKFSYPPGALPAYTPSEIVSTGQGEIFENGADLFGKFTLDVVRTGGSAGLRQVIDLRRQAVAALKQRLGAGKVTLAAAQAPLETTAVAGSMRAKAVDDELRALGNEIQATRGQLESIATGSEAALASERRVSFELTKYFNDPANVQKTTDQVLADFTSFGREPGKSLQADLLKGGPGVEQNLRKVIDVSRQLRRVEQVTTQGYDSLRAVRRAQSELDAALKKSVQTLLPVELPPTKVPIFVPNGVNPVTLDGAPRTIELPQTVSLVNRDAVVAVKAELAAQEKLIQAATDGVASNLKVFDDLIEGAFTDMRYGFMNVSREDVNVLRRELYVKQGAYKSAVIERDTILKQESIAKANVEITAPRELATPGSPAAVKTGLPSGSVEKAVEKQSLLERPFFPPRAKFATFLAEKLGNAIDLGTEAWQSRDGIVVLRSDASGVIVVERKPDGTIQVGQLGDGAESASPTLVATQPRLFGRALPDGIDDTGSGARPIPAIARNGLGLGADGPLAYSDSGEQVARNPLEALRLDRRAALLRRIGAQTRLTSSIGSTGFPLPFEPDPNPTNMLGVVRPSEPQGAQGKGGYLIRDFPFSDVDATLIDSGFPSDLIAVDSNGAIYLENANSSLEYGGRIFKFAGDPVQREHVGSVSYYSLDLQYGRPTQPRAMEIAEAADGAGGKVEDLFIADLDPGIYFNTSIPPTNRILRVPIHQLSIPFYASGGNRNRLVGQPYAEHPDFQMTGPSDLEHDTISRAGGSSARRLLFFSDEENLFALADANGDGQAEVSKIVSLPGRRWSGIAVDSNGHLYFADYASGEVFLLPSNELDLVLAAGTPIASEEELQQRGFLLKVGLDRPGDLELDTWQQRYLVSTGSGIIAFDIPTVGRLGADVTELHVDVVGREVPVTLRRDRGGIFIAGTNSEGPFSKTVRMRVRRNDPDTHQAVWSAETFATVPFGTSIVPGTL